MTYPREACQWREDEDGNWWTACGEGHTLIDGTPIENSMRYCCYCGRTLVEVRHTEADSQDGGAG